MRNFSKMAQTIILGGVVIILQTSCSKEQNKNQLADPAKKTTATLSRAHSEVLTFVGQYDNYLDGDPTDFPDLSREDAEWILEAAYNYSHSFDYDSETDAVEIEYTEMDNMSVSYSTETGSVLEATLYETYHNLISAGSSYTDIAPISDIEILPGDPNFVLTFKIAQPIRIYNSLDPGVAYIEDAFAVGPVINGPMGPRNFCGSIRPFNDPQYYAYNMLTKNLGVHYDPRVKQGYHTDVYTNHYADDSYDASTYLGFLNPTNDYSSSIWGVGPGDNGEPDQCLSPSQLTDYENAIKTWVNTETPSGLTGHNVIVGAKQSLNTGSGAFWWHHTLTFTWSKFTIL